MKVKVGFNRSMDMLKFKNLAKEREQAIRTSFTDKVKYDYPVNNLARELHQKDISVTVTNIKKETMDAKTFTLKRVDGGKLPIFRAGQYIVIEVKIGGVVYKRPYSITSSPLNLDAYDITIKRVRNGIVSNYMLNEGKENLKLKIHGPFGDFTYEPLRDREDILALVGGSGITPIMSLARAIKDKLETCNLTIIYGEKSERDVIFKKELDDLAQAGIIKVKYVLSDENSNIYESGLISKDIISSYDLDKYSYFVCGTTYFYHYLNDIFVSLDIPNKYIRHDIYREVETLKHIEHTLTVLTNDKEITIPCYEDETLIESLEKEGIEAPSKCMVGVCGYCRSKLISGEVKTNVSAVREADKKYNYIHPCVTYPMSDVTIKLCK